MTLGRPSGALIPGHATRRLGGLHPERDNTVLRLLRVITILVLAFSWAMSASAQDSTPVAGGKLLTQLGLPELNLVGTDEGLSHPSSSVEAGRYLISLDVTAKHSADLALAMATDKYSYDDLAKLFQTTSTSGSFPKDLYSVELLGGVAGTASGQTGYVVMDLKPGEYLLGYETDSDSGDTLQAWPYKLTVTGTFPSSVTDPKADVVVKMHEMAFDMPDSVASGDRIWEMEDTGAQLHFMDLVSYPDAFTSDQLIATLQSMFAEGTPSADASPQADTLDPSKLQDVWSSQLYGAGATNWIELNLPPGHYAALCWIPDEATGQPHVMMGMYKVFDVT